MLFREAVDPTDDAGIDGVVAVDWQPGAETLFAVLVADAQQEKSRHPLHPVFEVAGFCDYTVPVELVGGGEIGGERHRRCVDQQLWDATCLADQIDRQIQHVVTGIVGALN